MDLAWLMPLSLVCGLVLDRWLGEPEFAHPLVGFGRLAGWLERALNKPRLRGGRARGALALTVLVLPVLLALIWLWEWAAQHRLWQWGLGSVALYLALGWKSLEAHIAPILTALKQERLVQARQATALIVSRDCQDLSAGEVARAATESLLENTSDAVIAPMFWFALAGVPGVIGYRLVNTLDAMWGYRNERFADFGWAAARLDDALNFIPARLTAIGFIVCSRSWRGVDSWRRCAAYWASPNAGPVLASGAGSLGVSLGGPASYHGIRQSKPATPGRAVAVADLPRAIGLARRTVIFSALVLVSGRGLVAWGAM